MQQQLVFAFNSLHWTPLTIQNIWKIKYKQGQMKLWGKNGDKNYFDVHMMYSVHHLGDLRYCAYYILISTTYHPYKEMTNRTINEHIHTNKLRKWTIVSYFPNIFIAHFEWANLFVFMRSKFGWYSILLKNSGATQNCLFHFAIVDTVIRNFLIFFHTFDTRTYEVTHESKDSCRQIFIMLAFWRIHLCSWGKSAQNCLTIVHHTYIIFQNWVNSTVPSKQTEHFYNLVIFS